MIQIDMMFPFAGILDEACVLLVLSPTFAFFWGFISGGLSSIFDLISFSFLVPGFLSELHHFRSRRKYIPIFLGYKGTSYHVCWSHWDIHVQVAFKKS